MNFLCIVLSCLGCLASWTSAVSRTEGTFFLISAPSMPKYYSEYDPALEFIRLVLKLQARIPTTVEVTSEGRMEYFNPMQDVCYELPTLIATNITKKSLYYTPSESYGYRWLFRLTAALPFTVMVVLQRGLGEAETFTAVPVQGWGQHYVIFTLETHFAIILINSQKPQMIILTLSSPDNDLKFQVGEHEYKKGESMIFNLESFQAFAFSSCGLSAVRNDITGSSLKAGAPFGVVVGNCIGVTKARECEEVDNSKLASSERGSTVAEMLLPAETFGRHFILFKAAGRDSKGFYIITSSTGAMTTIHVGISVDQTDSTYQKYQLEGLGSSISFDAEFRWLIASHPVQVGYAQNSSCIGGKGNGGPSLLMMVPIELFTYMYDCIVPDVEMHHYLILVVKTIYSSSIKAVYTNQSEANPILGNVEGINPEILMFSDLGRWHVFEYKVDATYGFTVYSLKTKFGCYMHGVSVDGTYMHAAGFVSSNINKMYCNKTENVMTKDDLLDNDCDGWFDEEYQNDLNDDGSLVKDDTAVDEDLGTFFWAEYKTLENRFQGFEHLIKYDFHLLPAEYTTKDRVEDRTWTTPSELSTSKIPRGDYEYMEWSEWHCVYNCSLRDLYRNRTCLRITNARNCEGPSYEVKNGTCYTKYCSMDCPLKTFGDHCQHMCSKCKDRDCDKFSGACRECVMGYDHPESGCILDRRMYLDWTPWHCTSDCAVPYFTRERYCNPDESSCTETIVEKKPGDCYVFKKCASECQDFEYGEGCEKRCDNCQDSCDKFTGACNLCVPGFMNPKGGCLEPCGPYKYGAMCQGDCTLKCPGEDCVDRVEGTCSKCKNYTYGKECEFTCDNCLEPCNKITGVCDSCKEGFKFPNVTCKEPCGMFEYGPDCTGDCIKKCGEDCGDRTDGACSKTSNKSLWPLSQGCL
ncbi:uncharacterized protein LOC106058234 isoform X3 [Biomphalaria glabrata]|uniref:Uncharacterized protein LOC106058234 isoform X3 n=1 Tax=Biomphalaria glabrata TaxID=6526 RepID=A0A9W2ZFD0_BIOGL|nr:uncharacterized protein LOC106058234 isoform X3 [Biomphalaria glabrata]